MENKITLSQMNQIVRNDLITEEIMTGRESRCGSWGNPEMFPRKPFSYECGTYFCPVCGYENVVSIKKKVSKITNDFQRNDGILYLLTLNIPHNKYTDLNDLYGWYSQSVRRMKNSSVWRNSFKKDLDHQFHYNRYETTITPSNSFHPHLHITLGGYNLIDTNEWKKTLTNLWRRCCRSVGVIRLPTITNGVDIRITSNGTYSMKLNEDTTIPNKQDSYTPEDLQKILTGYKRISGYRHMDFSLKEIKKYLTKYRKVFQGKKYLKIYFNNDDYKWKWEQERRTLEGLFV